jgi:hypothetical protein
MGFDPIRSQWDFLRGYKHPTVNELVLQRRQEVIVDAIMKVEDEGGEGYLSEGKGGRSSKQ